MSSTSSKIPDFQLLKKRLISVGAVCTELCCSGKEIWLFNIDGLVDTQRLSLLQYALQNHVGDLPSDAESFAKELVCIHEYSLSHSPDEIEKLLFSGMTVLLSPHLDRAVMIGIRKPPTRSISEPDKAKTLRGPHEGFCENIIINLALVRRRIRSAALNVKKYVIGEETRTDVCLLYMDTKADKGLVKKLDAILSSIKVKALGMTQESLASQLFGDTFSRLDPYPKLRYTERPDTVSAMLLEGKLVILCDTSPSAMILPVSLFDFFEESDDYYFPILTGSYMKIVRLLVYLATVYLAPLWLVATKNTDILPSLLSFVGKVEGEYTLPIFLQLLIIEFAVDGLKLASLNTPSALSNSLSVVGGLLLGDYAIKSGWFIPQTILYSAFTAMANFVPSNLELGYCFKFQRMILIVAAELFGLWGIASVSLIFFLLLAFTKRLDGKSYLYPLIPFSGKAFFKMFFKTSKGREEE
ncbi:MAG: spore germination protein [Ruminococcaceae bacterium]|nr:spore germination protein [Oscillospiraceae bacterium]